MKIIPTFLHGTIDYIYAATFIFLPNLFGFTDIESATLLARILGVGILVQALTTRYELGVVPLLSMRAHLAMDYVLGIFMIVAPWLFNFSGTHAWLPFVILGLAEEGATMMTQTQPSWVSSSHSATI